MMITHSATELGTLVQSRRKDLGWTQSMLAEKAGVSRPWISQFKTGKRTAHIGLVFRVIKELGLTADFSAGDPNTNSSSIDLYAIIKAGTYRQEN